MTTLDSITRGLRRAFAEPKVLLILWLVNSLAALPAAIAVGAAIHSDVGASRFQETLTEGFDMDWYAEYGDRNSSGVPSLFAAQRTGGALVYENLDALFGGRVLSGTKALAPLVLIFGLAWILLQGGVIARLTRERVPGDASGRFSAGGFFADAGRFFLRFLVLAALAGFAYYALYRIAGWGFGRVNEAFRDTGTERQLMMRVVLGGAILVFLLNIVRMVFDYAKIDVVSRDLRFAPMAIWRGVRFVVAHPISTFGVALGIGLLSLVVLGLYSQLAPGPGQSTALGVIAAFLVSQLFVAGRIFLRVALLGAEANLYRQHGGV